MWGAALLVVLGAGALYALWPSPRSTHRTAAQPEPVPSELVSAAASAPVDDVRPGPPALQAAAPAGAPSRVEAPLPSVDLFATRGPEIIDVAHDIVFEGGTVSLTKLKDVYQYAKEHPGDARPHLIMAADAMNRGWYDQAVDHYVRAAKEDARARQDGHMLSDLIKIAGREHSAQTAGDALEKIYGKGAVEAVQQAMNQAAQDDDDDRATRLSELLGRLDSNQRVPPK